MAASNMPAPKVHQDASDEWLLLRYRTERRHALFAELVARYERELFGYLRRYLGSTELAEDAFQATFLQVHLKCDQFEEGRPLRPWLYMIATNKAIDMKRRNGRLRLVSIHGHDPDVEGRIPRLSEVLESNVEAPESALDRTEQGEWVLRSLEELPEHLRLVVHLVYFQGLKYREVAEVLSIPVGTVKSRMNAAISKLTEFWENSITTSE